MKPGCSVIRFSLSSSFYWRQFGNNLVFMLEHNLEVGIAPSGGIPRMFPENENIYFPKCNHSRL